MTSPAPSATGARSPKTGSLDDEKRDSIGVDVLVTLDRGGPEEAPAFRLYKRRFAGLVGLFLLNVAGGMGWPWFGPIANDVASELHFSLNRVNWLGNIFSCIYLPVALAVPRLCTRYGVRRSCEIGAAFMVLASWIRYAGTSRSLSPNASYALLLVGQLLMAVAQPIFQILGPKYSEVWFNLKGRTTATMILSIANPVGGAIGQLLSPLVGDVRFSILVLGIICTALAPSFLLIGAAPPTPPTYSASQRAQPLSALVRAWAGLPHPTEAHMSVRERLDFTILTVLFGVLVAATTAFSLLSGQYLGPYGYSSDDAGIMGAVLIVVGLVASIVTAPLYDRVFTRQLGVTVKCLCPVLGAAWLSLIWAIRPHNTGALYAILAIIGGCSVTMLPVGLELGVEITRNAEASSAILWFSGNLFTIIFLLSEDALRSGPSAHPPLNMRRAIIFQSATVFAVCAAVFAFRGKQSRREVDEERSAGAQQVALDHRSSS